MTRNALLMLTSLLAGYGTGWSQALPVSLREVLMEVHARHPTLAAARALVRAAQGNRAWARAIDNPVFSLQLENVRVPGRVPVPADRETMYTATLPLETIYQRGPRVRQAGAALEAARADSGAVVLQLSLEAARAYYRTALAQLDLETAADLTTWLDSVAAYNRVRAAEGLAAGADLLRSEVERDRMRAEVAMRAAELAGARAELAGFFPERDSMRPVALPREPLSPGSESAGLAAPLPRVEAQRQRLRAMDAAVATERWMLVPRFGFMVGAKESAGRTSLLGGVSLPLPLFTRNGGRIAQAKAARDAAGFALALEERTARSTLAATAEASRRLSAEAMTLTVKTADGSSAYLTRADELRRIALGAYQEGAVPLLTVVDAARAWGEARVTYYKLLFAQHEAVLAHFAARGIDPLEALLAPTGETRP